MFQHRILILAKRNPPIELLQSADIETIVVPNAEQALKQPGCEVVIIDTEACEITLLPFIIKQHTKCLLLAENKTVQAALLAMQHGVFEYLVKPFSAEEFVTTVKTMLQTPPSVYSFSSFYELSQALASAMPLQEQLQLTLKTVQACFGADGVSLFVADLLRPSELIQRTSLGPESFFYHHPKLMAALHRGEAILAQTKDIQAWVVNPKRVDAQMHSFMAVALQSGGTHLGMLTAFSLQRGWHFTEGQRQGLQLIADRTASVIDASRLYTRLQHTFTQTVEGFAKAIETKDAYTRGHSDRVAMYARLIAETLGLSEAMIDQVSHGGLMHDIGKIGLHSGELQKPQKLTAAEYQAFKRHPGYGRRIIEPIHFLTHLVPCIYHHHESFDGTGYPEGLRGLDIPLEARILAVADSYDAMTSNRPYRKALPHDVTIQEFKRCASKQFDPYVVEAFLSCIGDFRVQRKKEGLPVPN